MASCDAAVKEVEISFTQNPASGNSAVTANQIVVTVPIGNAQYADGFSFSLPAQVVEAAGSCSINALQ